MFSFFLFPILLASAPLEQVNTMSNQPAVHSFLERVASAESSEWDHTLQTLKQDFPEWMKESTARQILNQFAPMILEQNDLDFIRLYQRALRNHDALSKEKAEPFPVYYKHYQPPSFQIPDIALTLDVKSDHVLITSHLSVKPSRVANSLVLDGKNHNILSVHLNGQPLPKERYRMTPNELIINDVPQKEPFTVTVQSSIDPFKNRSFEGLYGDDKCLSTQCESEGARRIFFTLDRPDVLSRITTSIIADPIQYPYRLSNGNLISESREADGRLNITWEDPIPKPSYLFAAVLGNFDRLEDDFTTKSGRKVKLEVYVEPGKAARGNYSLMALKQAMQFDEDFFDREYDLDYMKMVGVPGFNMGAMENKGLMIFNNTALLVDPDSGTDASFRRIAWIVAHEYFHNWSGNRVTVRNWFELALKEAFTDFRAMLFSEWQFGSAFVRPKDVVSLREQQFPEEHSGKGHPIIVESYVEPSCIYDATTYTKGREVFRMLQTYMDMMVPGSFREAQNLYFSTYDGQAVTFRELLQAANEVLLRHTGKNLSQFERWFTTQGTPVIKIALAPQGKNLEIHVEQSYRHPKTGKEQESLSVPFSYEFLRPDGSIAWPKTNFILSEKSHVFAIPMEANLIPVFMHGYSAPVICQYDYSLQDLACIMNHATDAFSQWEAGQNYALAALMKSQQKQKKGERKALFQPYVEALQNPHLSPLAKAQLLQLPTLRAMSQKLQDYDFPKLKEMRERFVKDLAKACRTELKKILKQNPEPTPFAPTSAQMQIRELRNACWNLLAQIDPKSGEKIAANFSSAHNFDTAIASFRILANLDLSEKNPLIEAFYQKWKEDREVFNFWLQAQTGSSKCTVSDVKRLMNVNGFDVKNPNHLRSVLTGFISNLGQYHDTEGAGYAFIVDKILEISQTNPLLAHNNLTVPAFVDFVKLPEKCQALMIPEMQRLLVPAVPPETRDFIEKLLKEKM